MANASNTGPKAGTDANRPAPISSSPDAAPTSEAAPSDPNQPLGFWSKAWRSTKAVGVGIAGAANGIYSTGAGSAGAFADRNNPELYKKRKLENGGAVTSTDKPKSVPWDPTKAWNEHGNALVFKTERKDSMNLQRRGGMIPENAFQFITDAGEAGVKAVVELRAGTPLVPTDNVVLASFENFVLSGISMQDQERFDVVETFGQPHIFASGRFIRRYQFNGHMFTVPLYSNKSAKPSMDATALVPPIFAWKSFYEQYLRASQSAKNNVYVRVRVPSGDVFNGYIVATSDGRESSSELTTPFSFMMLVVSETDTWNSNKLFQGIITPTKTVRSTVNKASLDAAIGAFEIKISVNSGAPAATGTVDLGLVKADSSKDAPVGAVDLICSHSGYILNTTTTIEGGFSLIYDDGTPVNGSPSRSGSSKVEVRVLKYETIRKAHLAVSAQSSKAASVSFLITNNDGKDASLTASFTSEDSDIVEMVNVTFGTGVGTLASAAMTKTDDRWQAVVNNSETEFNGLTLPGILTFQLAPKGQTTPITLDPSKIKNPEAIFKAFQGLNTMSDMGNSVDGPILTGCSIDAGPISVQSDGKTFVVPVHVKVPQEVVDVSGNPVPLLAQATGIGGLITLFLDTGSGFKTSSYGLMVELIANMKQRAAKDNPFDLANCTYYKTSEGFTCTVKTKKKDLSDTGVSQLLYTGVIELAGSTWSSSVGANNNADITMAGLYQKVHVVNTVYPSTGEASIVLSFQLSGASAIPSSAEAKRLDMAIADVKSIRFVSKSGDRVSFKLE